MKKSVLGPLMSLAKSLRRLSDLLERAALKEFSKRELRRQGRVNRDVIQEGLERRELDEIKDEILHGIVEIGETVAREVMVPRTDMVTIETSSSIREVLDVFISAGHSRIPVYKDRIDNIVGILYSKDLLNVGIGDQQDFDLKSTCRPAYFIPESKSLASLLREFQRNRVHIAIVVDEYGGTAGLITLEDILEKIIGEIEDEYDFQEEKVLHLDNGEMVIDARLDIESVEELLNIEIEKGEFESIGGLAINVLGHLPGEGETFSYKNHEFVVEKATDRKVVKIRVRKNNGC